MNHEQITVNELWQLLPETDELEELRLSVLEAARPDPGHEWARASTSATVDMRVVGWEQLDGAFAAAEAALQRRVETLFTALRALAAAYREGREADGIAELIRLGEAEEQAGDGKRALKFYLCALSLSLPLADKAPQVLALRRVGRAHNAGSEPQEALAHYRRSAALARDAGDLHGEIVATIGIGNALAVQGFSADAERHFLQALAQAEPAYPLERAQLLNNLGQEAIRQGDFASAAAWLESAREFWEREGRPDELAICFHHLAHLREQQGDGAGARALWLEALERTQLPHLRAGLAVDLTESLLRAGLVAEAEQWGRRAEQFAIAARSPYLLARVYQELGNVACAQGNGDGFTFFEKALQIARERALHFLEADVLLDYAQLRQEMGGPEEAHAYLEAARDGFARLGREQERAEAERRLAAVQPPEPQPGA